jgi:hypothetical protein
MANPNLQNAKEILQGLLRQASGFTSGVGQSMQAQQQMNPVAILSQMLVDSSMQPSQQDLQQSAQGTQQRLEGMGQSNTDPLQDATLKELIKVRKQQVQEAAQSGVPLEFIAQQSGIPMANQFQPGLSQGATPVQPQQQPQPQQETPAPTPEQAQKGRNILMDILRGAGMGFTQDFRAGEAAIEGQKTQTALGQQELAGEKPLQKGEAQKILLTSLYSGKGNLDAQKQQEAQQAFQSNLVNLVDAWEGLGAMKGAIGGTVGGVGAATIGRVFGDGREARTRFESLANGVLYSVGDYVLGQSGRALVEADLKRLEKMAKFDINMNPKDFRGKLQSILDFANSKIEASGQEPEFRSVDEFMNNVKQRNMKRPSAPNNNTFGIKSITPISE